MFANANGYVTPAQAPATARPLYNFYGRFSDAKGKPFVLSETGSVWKILDTPQLGGPSELQVKQPWWNDLFSAYTLQYMPLFRGFLNFEERKKDGLDVPTNPLKDWKIVTSSNEEIKSAFLRDLNANAGRVLFANELRYYCDGSVRYVPRT